MTDLPDLSSKVAVITGASRGLGAGVAEAWGARGIQLALCARSSFAAPAGAYAAQVDVASAAAVAEFAQATVERFGRIDLWLNNAGVLEPVGFVHDLGSEAVRQHLAINALGAFHGTQAFVRHLRQREGEGVLLNVSSGAALSGYAGWGPYCMGKAALDRLTECVQLEEAAHGLLAYAVAPGVIDTAMQATIRGCSPEVFPAVAKFHDLKAREAFNSPGYVAHELLRLAYVRRPTGVVQRLEPEA
ncbi:MAG: SDR family NAD(P)-dependent oxidoreductase [Planctomycetes bacterium]|nr:SDR family NAD(P)-dependent oxidoreductase [Planctomycetota bacterium]